MKVVELKAENFKRLQAVEIRPDDDMAMVVIAGSNDAGKSSVLDAIMSAIVGGRGMKDIPEPIRRGEDRAEVSLDLGDLKIKRVWEPNKNRVEVTNAEGQKYSSPQGILDALTSSLTFDPLEFARMQPRDQRATLLRLVELPFDIEESDRERSALVQAESAARQEVKRAESVVKPSIPDDTPDAETPASDIAREMHRRQEVIRQNDEKRRELDELNNRYSNQIEYVQRNENRVREIETELQSAKELLLSHQNKLIDVETEKAKQSALVDSLVDPDLTELEERLAKLDEVNRNVRQKRANAETSERLKAARASESAAVAAVKAHDKARAEALANAKFPVDGLGFSEDGVTLDGLPFTQASESQRIKTSVAMGMAMSPRLKVMMIRDGSSLDSKRMAEIEDMVKDQGYQIWCERVDESGAVGICIEDGMVKEEVVD